MAYEPPVAVLDACVLYPFHTRNLLVECAVGRLLEARWTDRIHDEWVRNLAGTPGLDMERLLRTRDLMRAAVPGADVTGYETLVPAIDLPDSDDRHVVAAAVAGGASVIVTWNIRDFPEAALALHGLRAESPDRLMLRLHAAAPDAMLAVVAQARRNLRVSRPTTAEFLQVLARQGLNGFVAALGSRQARL